MKIKRCVWKNNGNGQKLITIPKDCSINPGDEVWIEKIMNFDYDFTIHCQICDRIMSGNFIRHKYKDKRGRTQIPTKCLFCKTNDTQYEWSIGGKIKIS